MDFTAAEFSTVVGVGCTVVMPPDLGEHSGKIESERDSPDEVVLKGVKVSKEPKATLERGGGPEHRGPKMPSCDHLLSLLNFLLSDLLKKG